MALLRQLALQRLKDGHGEEAESLAARALAINRSRLDPMGMETAWAACVLARIESRRKKYADSESHYREAIELYRKYRQPYLIGHLLGELEPVMRHQERNAEFQKFSLELANEGGVRGLTVLALRKLMSGDAAGYQNDCQQLLELCSNSANLDALETVIFACTFREDALKDWTQATLLAQKLFDPMVISNR